MMLRAVACGLYAVRVGMLIGLFLLFPAAITMAASGTSPLAMVLILFVAGGAGFVGGVIAVRDEEARRRGMGGLAGFGIGLAAMAYTLWHDATAGVARPLEVPADMAGPVVGFAAVGAVGFLCGRAGERSARWSLDSGVRPVDRPTPPP